MSFTYRDRPSDSPYIKTVWETEASQDGVYVAAVDGCWDIIISQESGKPPAVVVNGQGTAATAVPYRAGTRALGISLMPSVYMTVVPVERLLNNGQVLPLATAESFWIDGQAVPLPSFDTVEQFIDRLVRAGIIASNEVVEAALAGQPKALSSRSMRRHFVRTTGLSPYFFHQVRRAQHAVRLLQQGVPPTQASAEAGYTDQSHMTKAVKQLVGYTPAQIIDRDNSA